MTDFIITYFVGDASNKTCFRTRASDIFESCSNCIKKTRISQKQIISVVGIS